MLLYEGEGKAMEKTRAMSFLTQAVTTTKTSNILNAYILISGVNMYQNCCMCFSIVVVCAGAKMLFLVHGTHLVYSGI